MISISAKLSKTITPAEIFVPPFSSTNVHPPEVAEVCFHNLTAEIREDWKAHVADAPDVTVPITERELRNTLETSSGLIWNLIPSTFVAHLTIETSPSDSFERATVELTKVIVSKAILDGTIFVTTLSSLFSITLKSEVEAVASVVVMLTPVTPAGKTLTVSAINLICVLAFAAKKTPRSVSETEYGLPEVVSSRSNVFVVQFEITCN